MSIQKRRGKAAEVSAAKALGGVLVPYSGAGKVKGDVHTDNVFIQVKSSGQKTGLGKSITLKKVDIEQMLKEQIKEKKDYHLLYIHFLGDHSDYVVMTVEQAKRLIDGNNKNDSN